MKRFISRVQSLSQKAAELKAAMQQVPPKVAEIREAVAATTGQLQQLKSEIHYSVADLKADNEDHLSEALQVINASADVFAKAGFLLSGIDLEISPVQRLLVHLSRVETVHASVLRSLASANQHRRATHAILSALLQANQMADTVELGDLIYDEVIVGIGPIPSVRLCWRPEEIEATPEVQPNPAVTVALPLAAAAPLAPAPAQSPFGAGSFFERREAKTPAPEPQPAALPTVVVPSVPQEAVVSVTPGAAPASSADPLARFKKMPVLSR